jgi:hypothetical protein
VAYSPRIPVQAEVVEAVRERAARSPRAGKGRGGKPKPRKTSATIRTPDGFKVTVEHRRGVDDEAIRAALLAVLAHLDARNQGRGEAA